MLGRKEKKVQKKNSVNPKGKNLNPSRAGGKLPDNQNSGPTSSGPKQTTRRRRPRAAAVTIICPPGQYAETIGIARNQIDLKELGIDSLRPKKAATGALILEIETQQPRKGGKTQG